MAFTLKPLGSLATPEVIEAAVLSTAANAATAEAAVALIEPGVPGGIATLDVDGAIPESQVPARLSVGSVEPAGLSDATLASLSNTIGTAVTDATDGKFATPSQVTTAIEAAALDGVDVSGLAATPPSALARLRAVCTFRNLRPVVLGWAGSSTWFGSAATTTGRRAVNIATAKIQARYPLTTGTEVATRTLSVAVDALPFGPGIQSVNAGVGGTTVANYLTETTRTQLMSTAPDAIMHMILSNDFKFQTPLDTFKATLLGQINALDALAPGVPPIHVLFQPHERYDATFTPTIPFSEYGRVTAELAAANPDRMVFLDLSPAFRKLGIPGTDIYQLMNADLVHLGDEGHAFLGELVYDALFQQLSVSKAAAALPVPGFPTSTTTALVLNPTAPATGATTTLTATVTPTAAGSVEFFDGATSRGSAAVAGGVASIVTPALAAGAHSFTATFTPADATAYSSSTSPAAAITVATPGQTYSRYTSDGFSAVDGTQLVGSTSDAANGGTEQTWVGTGSLPYLSTLGGKAVRGSQIAAAFLGFKTTASAGNQRVSIKLDTLPAVDLQLVARRNQVASGAGLSQYQAIITPAGTATLNKTVSNMASTIGTAHAVAAGDVVGLYCYETTVALQINGVTVETVTDTTVTYVSSGANAGVRVGSTGAVSIDDFALDLVS